jgi:nitrate/nitrite-specific signal transduction histidine kinase
MSIRIKLILGYVILSLLVAISSYFGIRGIQVAEDGSRYITEQTIPVIESLGDLRFAGLRIVSSTSEFLLILSEKTAVNEEEGEEEERNEIQLASQLYQESFVEYALLVEAFFHDERAFVEAISLSGKKLQQTSLELIALKEKGEASKGILELKEMFEKQEKQYLKDVHDALAHEEEELMNGQEHVEAIVQRAINTMILVGISSFIIAVLLGILIARSLSEPMHKLSQAAKIIGSGNFDIQIDYQSSDEMGVLAAAFNTMADNLAKILVNKDQLETLVVKRTDELRKARAELESLVEE